MRAGLNFIEGFKATGKASQMVVLLFLINFLFSLVLAVPMYHSLKESIGQSQMGEKMVEGFDYLWWQEFRDESKGLEKTFTPGLIGKGALLNNLEALVQMRFLGAPPVVLITGLFYLIVHVFLAGGILSIFNQEFPRFSLKDFFQGAGTYFLRFLLLMLVSWVFFLAIGIFLKGGLDSFLDNISDNSISEVTPFYLGLLFSAIVLFFLLFIQMVFDYARIKIVVEERKNILKSSLEAFGFVFRHFVSALGLYYLIFAVSVIVAVIYISIKELIPQAAFWEILIAFVVQQLFIFMVIWMRCWFYASQMKLYKYWK